MRFNCLVQLGIVFWGLLLGYVWPVQAQQPPVIKTGNQAERRTNGPDQFITQTDTLKLTAQEADYLLIKQNLTLLAQTYKISAQQALILQVGLLPNPTLHLEGALYTKTRGQLLDVAGPDGQSIVAVSQLIRLGGKRKSAVAYQEALKQGSIAEMAGLIADLRYRCRTNIIALWANKRKQKLFSTQLDSINHVITAAEVQVKLGNLAERELVRMQALSIALIKELEAEKADAQDLQGELRLLLNIRQGVELNISYLPVDPAVATNLNLKILLDSARLNRPELKINMATKQAAVANERLQKALAYPDLSVGYMHDYNSNYQPFYNGLTVDLELPFFDRNQGNIMASKANTRQVESLVEQSENAIVNQVTVAYSKLIQSTGIVNVRSQFAERSQRILTSCLDNYKRRNISLLEFLDCYDAHRLAAIDLIDLAAKQQQYMADLNYYTASKIIP